MKYMNLKNTIPWALPNVSTCVTQSPIQIESIVIHTKINECTYAWMEVYILLDLILFLI